MSDGMVATSQPLAAEAGVAVLRAGGNAVDAAVCAAAVLGVVEPMSTGVGGDCFALVYEASSERLHGLNGSGRAPGAARIEDVQLAGHRTMPQEGILSVTVPGALRAWDDLVARFGTRSLGELLQPAVRAAREGFALTPVIARDWARSEAALRRGVGTDSFLLEGRAPRSGEPFAHPELARSLALIAADGVKAFYDGPLTRAIVRQSRALGGWLDEADFAEHASEWVDPISIHYRGREVFELPPNGQGIVALQALRILDGLDLASVGESERLHAQIEAIKLAFADGWRYVADPAYADVPVDALLSERYAAARRALVGERALSDPRHGFPEAGTVYVAAVDGMGNVASLINSVYMHFGANVVAGSTGIVLHNRGALFELDPSHPNALAPGKRPYHTIIPALAFQGDRPWLTFGVVGGTMQPQGHVQLLGHLLDSGLSLQEAVEAPRFRWVRGAQVTLEDGFDDAVRRDLQARGHALVPVEGHGGFGGAQMIQIDPETGALSGASDPRKDGGVGAA